MSARIAGSVIIMTMIAPTIIGCGASSLRLGAGPITDSDGHIGFESTVSLGIGMPLDYSGQSHHFVQGIGYIGGGVDDSPNGAGVTTGAGFDYVYWAHPRFDVRTGMQFVYRNRGEEPQEFDFSGFGAHLAFMPAIVSSNESWILFQFCLGPDLRVDQTWDSRTGKSRAFFAVPLVAEVNLMATGD